MDFVVNKIQWKLIFVEHNNYHLRRSDGSYSVGATDRNYHSIYISNAIQGRFLRKVICHEVCHCAMFSYNVYLTVDQEELVADIIATYGDDIICVADSLFERLKKGIA